MAIGAVRDAVEAIGRAFTAEEAAAAGVRAWELDRLERAGGVWRIARGIYLPGSCAPDGRSFAAEAALRFPGAALVLRSAAELHGLTFEQRPEAFLAVPASFRPVPRRLGNGTDGWRPVRWVRWASRLLGSTGSSAGGAPGADEEAGFSRMVVHGVPVRVSTPARTVVDLFRYSAPGSPRSLFGRDEALAALDRFLAGREGDPELDRLAASLGAGRDIALVLDGRRALVTRGVAFPGIARP